MTFLVALASCLIAGLSTVIVIELAKKFKIVDTPKDDGRRVHKKPIPLMGGLAIFIAIVIVTSIVLIRTDILTSGNVSNATYIGVMLAALVLIVGGIYDDKCDLPPQIQVLFPIFAAIIVIASGLGVEKLTNPFGGVIYLETNTWELMKLGAHSVALSLPGDLLVFIWLIGMMFTTKLLDGLDGLATSIGSVGALMVLLLASTVAFFQPDIVVFAGIVLGAFVGFLIWNTYPAKIFLGESGALLVGFMLASLAVLSGGKIATLLLVMGIPILDVVWVMYRRLRSGEKVAKGDRLHLHHRLYDLGMTQRDVVIVYTLLAVIFGGLTLFLSSFAKLLALVILVLIVLIGAYVLLEIEKNSPTTSKGRGRK